MNEVKNLPRLTSWIDACPPGDFEMGIWDYIAFQIHPEDILISSLLFLPEFVEHSGLFVRADWVSKKAFLAYVANPHLSAEEAESSFNRIVLWDTFDSRLDVDDKAYEALGKMMQRLWKLILKDTFPSKEFHVEYLNSDRTYGPTVTAWCDRGTNYRNDIHP